MIFPGIIDGAVMRGTRGVELGVQCNRKRVNRKRRHRRRSEQECSQSGNNIDSSVQQPAAAVVPDISLEIIVGCMGL